MHRIRFTAALIAIFVFVSTGCLNSKEPTPAKKKSFVVAFYNLENLFDTVNDPLKNDEEFLPDTEKLWGAERLESKMKSLAEVIRGMNPDILGVCESENEQVLKDLNSRHLADLGMAVAYKESPDERGIDNGLLYKTKLFELVATDGIIVELPSRSPTRLILGVTLKHKKSKEIIRIYVNHWPSRRGGLDESVPNRLKAAEVLRTEIDQFLVKNPKASVICVGDFNDEPSDESITRVLGANAHSCDKKQRPDSLSQLFNLAAAKKNAGEGSYLYRSNWNMLDQIIVNTRLVDGKGIDYQCGSFEVYKFDKYVQKDERYAGSSLPTFGGKKYLGGVSDHFPVFARFVLN